MTKLMMSIALMLCSALTALAQVRGVVTDSEGQPLPFANAILYQGDKLVRGSVTDMDGAFAIENVKNGTYTLKLQMMGYETRDMAVSVTDAKKKVNVGTVALAEESHKVEEVSVVAQKQTMKLGIDRKVFDVSQDIASTGGSASDVLENVPSVEVDSEGNVSLRGSESVTVWINGKAQGMTSDNRGDILQQIPSESIESIEVITNPSSKYSAEGSAGIINIILKKDRKAGYYGGVQLNINSEKGGRLGANINYSSGLVDAYLNVGVGRRKRTAGGWTRRDYLDADGTPTGFLNSNTDTEGEGIPVFLRAGFTLHPTEKDEVSLGYMAMLGNSDAESDIKYTSDNYDGYDLINAFTRDRQTSTDDDMTLHNVDLSYRHTWKTGHFIEAAANFNKWEMEGWSVYDQKTYYDSDIEALGPNASKEDIEAVAVKSYQKQVNDINTKEGELKIDYEQLVGEIGKIEAGYNYVLSRENSPIETFADPEKSQSIESLFNRFKYDTDIHALYANWQHTVSPVFGYQLGLRGEWWKVRTTSYDYDMEYRGAAPDKFEKNYAAIFPTAYLSFHITETQELQLNYTRRLQRPHGGQMNSFKNINDSTNISFGNPLLTPEYSNSLELNYIKTWDNHTLSFSAYYRPSSDVIQQISYIDGGIRYQTNRNVAKDLSTGLEVIGKNRLWTRLDLTTTVNLYYYKLDGGDFTMTADSGDEVDIHVDDDDSFSWNLREMASVMLPKEITYQATFRYQAPTVITQGKRKANHSLDMGLRKNFAGRKFTLALNCRDILDSRARRSTSHGTGFSQESRNWRGGRRFILQFAWNFGNMKAKEGKRARAAESSGDEGDE